MVASPKQVLVQDFSYNVLSVKKAYNIPWQFRNFVIEFYLVWKWIWAFKETLEYTLVNGFFSNYNILFKIFLSQTFLSSFLTLSL